MYAASSARRRVFTHIRQTCFRLDKLIHRQCCHDSSITARTHTCGELRSSDEGKRVTLCGWVQRPRAMGKSGPLFVPLRDRTGISQLVVLGNTVQLRSSLEGLPAESVIEVDGMVQKRPDRDVNPRMPTGDVEVHVDGLKILNKAELQPFSVTEQPSGEPTRESLRLEHRYLDLRRQSVMQNIVLRSKVTNAMRRYLLEQHDFTEVETPTLFKRTPEGAREFLVPTRTPGHFYSLVQSPQQFKQLLMVGGIDRYFQLARCYRDEALRSDRQPEFTQLDLEMSFVDEKGVMNLIEGLMKFVSSEVSLEQEMNAPPFPRLTYKEAMERYGSDKPDTRYDLSIQHSVVEVGGRQWDVRSICIPDGANVLEGKHRESLHALFRESSLASHDLSWREGGLALVPSQGMPDSISADAILEAARLGAGASSDHFIAVHVSNSTGQQLEPFSYHWITTLSTLGKIRAWAGGALQEKGVQLCDPDLLHYLWIVDFPLFLPVDWSGTLESAHHPFTAPKPEHLPLLWSRPQSVLGQHYDLVLNGLELGGGSVRIHQSDLQERVVREVLRCDPHPLNHLLKALKAGCPPHAGIALGLDRFMAVLCKADSLRDVIAFPKSYKGQDLLTGAPSMVSESDLAVYNLSFKK